MGASSGATPGAASRSAAIWLNLLRQQTPRNSARVSDPLLGELVWLASGRRFGPLSDKTVARYQRARATPSRNLVASFWRRNWSFVTETARLTRRALEVGKQL